jgi:hypothetical protein
MNRFSQPHQRILYWSPRTSARSDICRTVFRGPIFGLPARGRMRLGGSFSAVITRGGAAPKRSLAESSKSWVNSVNDAINGRAALGSFARLSSCLALKCVVADIQVV